MAGWDGSGNFTRNYDWTDERDAGNNIDSTKFDEENETFRLGIESCIAKSGENAATADLQMGGFKHVGVADGTALTNYASVKQVQAGTLLYGGISGGSDNAQTITLTPTPTAIYSAQLVKFVAGFTNTGACTLDVNGLGATNIYDANDMPLVGGEIVEDRPYLVMLNQGIGAYWNLVNETPRQIAFHATNVAAATINTATITTVPWDTETYDYGSDFASNTFTAPVDGIYHFDACRSMSANATGSRALAFSKDGTRFCQQSYPVSSGTYASQLQISADVLLSASETVYVVGLQDSGSTLTLENSYGFFSGRLVQRV